MTHLLDILSGRGFLAQCTFEDDLREALNKPITLYVGFDPTADSLHIGSYIQIMALAHAQRCGHRVIALMGGGTAMIGDPSGRSDLRKMLTPADIAHNVECFKAQMRPFLDFDGENGAIIANNADWLMKLNYVEFIREIGVHFSVNRMLAAECYKQRMEKGLTFLEFNYMLMQGYDFLELWRRYGCTLQLGGDDQWSNILAGADLIRRKERTPAFALTTKLLLTSDGVKMGKTQSGAVWLSNDRTPPYELFQYFRNVDDKDVENCLKMLTFLPLDEIASLMNGNINEAKRKLAYEATKLVHDQAAADAADEAAASLFMGGGNAAGVPTTEITEADLAADNRAIVLAVKCGLYASNGEARRSVQQGGLYVNDERVSDPDARLTADMLPVMLRKGKKGFHRLTISN